MAHVRRRPRQIARLMSHRAEILARIEKAARAAAEVLGREPADVTLTAVSKQQPDERIDAVLAEGQRVFGENRVQEAQGRWVHRREGLELRLIGPLQSNKARDAVALFDVIETLDRPSLAKALADAIQRGGRATWVYVKV
jgi:uncharacterized pyridoxal phosphate-containing UPF0001 family protein